MIEKDSIYFELLRVLATALVVVGHSSIFYKPFYDILSYNNVQIGRDGVVIFFVLSGYVISWCGIERDSNWIDFSIKRMARIYSVSVPAVIFSFSIAYLFLELYNESSYPLKQIPLYATIYLTFTGYHFGLSETPPYDFPYWSLYYEVWFYVIFAILLFGRLIVKLFGIVLLALMGPDFWIMGGIWLVGVLLFIFRERLRVNNITAISFVILSIVSYIVVKYYGYDNKIDMYIKYIANISESSTWDAKPFWASDYFITVLVALNIIGAKNISYDWPKYISRLLRWIAGMSFTFYLFHVPIFSIIERTIKYDSNSFVSYILILSIFFFIIYTITFITEKRKKQWRAMFLYLALKIYNTKGHPDGMKI